MAVPIRNILDTTSCTVVVTLQAKSGRSHCKSWASYHHSDRNSLRLARPCWDRNFNYCLSTWIGQKVSLHLPIHCLRGSVRKSVYICLYIVCVRGSVRKSVYICLYIVCLRGSVRKSVYICLYIVYVDRSESQFIFACILCLHGSVRKSVYICLCMYVCVYIYIYIYCLSTWIGQKVSLHFPIYCLSTWIGQKVSLHLPIYCLSTWVGQKVSLLFLLQALALTAIVSGGIRWRAIVIESPALKQNLGVRKFKEETVVTRRLITDSTDWQTGNRKARRTVWYMAGCGGDSVVK
jgi:hypothetical protein